MGDLFTYFSLWPHKYYCLSVFLSMCVLQMSA